MSQGLSARLSGRIGALELEVAFEAPAGAVTALVGPSGAGKSTILRALAGLERLSGSVSVGGKTWQDGSAFLPPHRRAVGYVFQFGGLLPHLSVRGNLHYAQKRSGGDAGELAEAIAWLRLWPLLDRSPAKLSGGERARVALARALLTRPKLILLDEPLSGLDVESRDALLSQLADTLKRIAAPAVYVSHDPAEVARLADLVVHLRAGRIVDESADPQSELAGMPPERIAALAAAALRAGLEPEVFHFPGKGRGPVGDGSR